MGFRAFLVMDNKVARQAMDFRVSYATVVKVTRKAMAENGGKWWKMVENGGKWWKMAEKSSPRLFGRKWCFRVFHAIPLLLNINMEKEMDGWIL